MQITAPITFSLNPDPWMNHTWAVIIRNGCLNERLAELIQIEPGILWLVAVTDHLRGDVSPDNLAEMPGQSVPGRLRDLLSMFRNCPKSPQWRGADRIRFRVIFLMMTGKTRSRQETVPVTGACGPGDDGEPVITMMLPEDD